MDKTLYIIIPVYNEEEVLPVSIPAFCEKLSDLISRFFVSDKSRLVFVDDGSKDNSWEIIKEFSKKCDYVKGVKLSRNRGHQNALVAGLNYAACKCDLTITADCDGQDDPGAIDDMIKAYLDGCDIVYGVRSSRDTDSSFKRLSARFFYKLMRFFGVETVYDHADYRLMSSRAVKALLSFDEVNIYLRGLVPLVGFKSTTVLYKRNKRLAGKTKYPLSKMIKLAVNGITGFSTKPIRYITGLGITVSVASIVGIVWSVVRAILGLTVPGWASMTAIICFLGGIQLLSLGVIGEYIGKIYLETKHRPKYIIEEEI